MTDTIVYTARKIITMDPAHPGATAVAVRDGRIGYEESGLLLRFYEEGLNGYTYLEQ